MTSDMEKARSIFLVAIEEHEPDQWPSFLERACTDDDVLRGKVEKLLRAHSKLGTFQEQSVEEIAPTIDHSAAEKPDTYIGPYKLIEEIGAGGMGTVFMAIQKKPVRRTVALKVIKAGMDSQQVVSRFEAERQSLAMMDHPHIAKVLDGGTTESERPYFVMELVKGIPITEYCDNHRLTNRERLELFRDVCSAVHHAHQKGIIHRDLKPSNVLVTQLDDKPIPKIIDFGIAKAISGHLTDESFVTTVSQLVGTPMYMSPEQSKLTANDVDTRSDVYSLGVLLYELLTGATPFDGERMSSVSFDEFRRIVQEEDPPRPSTRLSTIGAALDTVAEKRHTDARSLSHEVSGELDWIVMKALEKDRTRRYESANELAKDVQRYLDDEAVEACPPSNVYRFRKFVHRNRNACIGASVLLVSTLIVLAAVSVASISRGRLAAHQHELANQQLLVQRKINDSLTEVARLRGQSELVNRRDDSALKQANDHMQRALALASTEPVDATLVAQVSELAAEINQQERERQLLSDLDRAWLAKADTVGYWWFVSRSCIPHFRKALEVYGIQAGRTSPEECAAIINRSSRAVQSEILASLNEWYALSTPLGGVYLGVPNGPGIIHTVQPSAQPKVRGVLKTGDQIVGVAIGSDGAMIDASEMTASRVYQLMCGARSTIKLRLISQGQTDPLTHEFSRGPTASWLEAVLKVVDRDSWRQRLREACVIDDEVKRWEELERLANEVNFDEQPVKVVVRLASELGAVNADERAVELLRRAWQREPSNVDVSLSLGGIFAFGSTPQPEEGVRYFSVAVALRPDIYGLRNNLGLVLGNSERWDEAAGHLRAATAIKPDLIPAYDNLGALFQEQGNWEEALKHFEKADELEPTQALYRSVDSAMMRAHLLAAAGRDEEYRQACRDVIERFGQSEDHEEYGHAARTCTIAPGATQDPSIPVELAKRAVSINPREWTQYTLGMAHLRAGEFDDASRRLQDSLRVQPTWHARYLNWLGLALVAIHQEDAKAAHQWLTQAVELMDRSPAKFAQDRLEGKILRREVERLLGISADEDAEAGQRRDE